MLIWFYTSFAHAQAQLHMKHIRTITIKDKEYYWSLKGHDIYTEGRWIIIGLKGTTYSQLYINPYAHDFRIEPRSIANAISFARSIGWRPEENSGNIHLSSNNGVSFKNIIT